MQSEERQIEIIPLDMSNAILTKRTSGMPWTLRRYKIDKDFKRFLSGLEKTRKGLISESDLEKINPNLANGSQQKLETPTSLADVMKLLGILSGEIASKSIYKDLRKYIIDSEQLKQALNTDLSYFSRIDRQREDLQNLSYQQAKIIEEKNYEISKLNRKNQLLEYKVSELQTVIDSNNLEDSYEDYNERKKVV